MNAASRPRDTQLPGGLVITLEQILAFVLFVAESSWV